MTLMRSSVLPSWPLLGVRSMCMVLACCAHVLIHSQGTGARTAVFRGDLGQVQRKMEG